jgi:taurine---2-oxoglutarate transaminase
LTTPSGVYEDKLRAGELLAEIAGSGLTKSFICLGGAEANENAVKMARLITGRHKIIARNRSYHGATLATLSISGDPRNIPFEPALPGVVRMGDPYCYRCPWGLTQATCDLQCADDLERAVLEAGPEDVAAVILEGVAGANGVFMPKSGYWRRIRSLCDKYGILLIADEVLSGFGRTGRWFAIQHEGIAPDLLTCAKGLTGGYVPAGAVLVSDRIAKHFEKEILLCGLTSYAHPLVCAGIVAAIEAYRSEDLIAKTARRTPVLQERMTAFAAPRAYVGEVRGVGLLWALELVQSRQTRAPVDAAQMGKLAQALKAEHLWTHKRDNMLYFAPPLVISDADLEESFLRLGRALDGAFGRPEAM